MLENSPSEADAAVAPALGLEAIRRALADAKVFTPLDLKLAGLDRNDNGNAQRMLARWPERLLHVQEVGWHGWADNHWNHKQGEMLARLVANEMHAMIRNEARALLEAGRWPSETIEDFEDRVSAHLRWAVASGNNSKIMAALDCYRPLATKFPDDLDADPLLFNCVSGILDLTDPGRIKCRGSRPGAYMTRVSPARFDKNAPCPRFTAFIQRILPDPNVRLFVQRWAGYLLTGDTSEQVVSLWWGSGANGKSVLAEVLKFVLANYAQTVQFSSLTIGDRRKAGADASPDIARLRGARAVFASEPERGVTFSEGLIKSLTGGEKIAARHLHQNIFEFRPYFKITLIFNEKPRVFGTDHGIWRRLRLVPFTETIPAAEQDKHLLDKLMGEAPGILNWMLDGYRDWRDKAGLHPPEAVLAATRAYEEESDPIGGFIGDAIEARPDLQLSAQDAYAAYKRWCHANAQTVFGQRFFGQRMGQTFARRHGRTGNAYAGAVLRDEYAGSSAAENETAPPEHLDDPGYAPEM